MGEAEEASFDFILGDLAGIDEDTMAKVIFKLSYSSPVRGGLGWSPETIERFSVAEVLWYCTALDEAREADAAAVKGR